MALLVDLAVIVGLLVLTLGGVAALVAVPVRLIAWFGFMGCLLKPTDTQLIASVGGLEVRLTDLFVMVVLFAAVVRGREKIWCWLTGLTMAIALYGFAITGLSTQAVAFGRILLPLMVGLALARLIRQAEWFWTDVAWFFAAIILLTPFANGINVSRWSSFAGGPNETGLVGACLIVLGQQYFSGWKRWVTTFLGMFGLFQAASITATGAAFVGIAVVLLTRPGWSSWRKAWVLVFVAAAIPVLVTIVQSVRADYSATFDAHYAQASVIDRALAVGDPVFGSGWGTTSVADLYTDEALVGLHNVYLDWLSAFGIIGLLALIGWFVMLVLYNRAVMAILLTVTIWMNTTGAFAGVGWGILGLILASAVIVQMHRPGDSDASPGRLQPKEFASA